MKKFEGLAKSFTLLITVIFLASCLFVGCKEQTAQFMVSYDIDGTLKENENFTAPTLPESAAYDVGTMIPVPEAPEAVEGWTFDGWYINDTKVEAEFELVEDVTFVAKYTENVAPEGPAPENPGENEGGNEGGTTPAPENPGENEGGNEGGTTPAPENPGENEGGNEGGESGDQGGNGNDGNEGGESADPSDPADPVDPSEPVDPSDPVVPPPPATRTIYFDPKEWANDDAKFEAWTWGGESAASWVVFTKDDSTDYYKTEIAVDRTGMKLLRKAPDSASSTWEHWNESGDIDIPSDKDLIKFTGWSTFEWDNRS